ncbi:MAG: hypothetical protein KatS3mg005_3407 [Bryobacteraceae bacterium]|nr:MAG: hypothetical protein KatS3mg005_3407 [Bryobacteraceae bacterium]
MAKTAEELREHIEEYLNLRIRSKAEEERTRREETLLAALTTASDLLVRQEKAKRESRTELIIGPQVASVLRAFTGANRAHSMLGDDEEEGEA